MKLVLLIVVALVAVVFLGGFLSSDCLCLARCRRAKLWIKLKRLRITKLMKKFSSIAYLMS